jgi:hypothetical protein
MQNIGASGYGGLLIAQCRPAASQRCIHDTLLAMARSGYQRSADSSPPISNRS